MVQSAAEHEPNKHASKSTESKGSNAPDPATLDLMSDLVSGSADFDPVPYLGYSFVNADIHADIHGIPHKMNGHWHIDKETGRILLEYIHGQVERVEPNILQEALLSHDRWWQWQ